MADKKKLVEHLKSLLIFLLLISALILLYSTGYFSSAMEKMGLIIHGGQESVGTTDPGSIESSNYGLAQAMEISVSARDGHRYSAMYDAETVDEDYSRFSAFLAEALGSASSPEVCNEAEWIRAVEGESVYIRYFAPQHIGLLAARLGTEFGIGNSEAAAEEFCLSCENNAVFLYYREEDNFFRCQSAVSDSVLMERIGEYRPNESFFSHSNRMLDGLKNSILIQRHLSEVPAIKGGSVGMSQIMEPLMMTLDINSYTASQYTESGGTIVFLDGNSVLRISSSGIVRYELSGNSALRASGKDAESIIEFSWGIVGSTVGAVSEGAQLYLSRTESDENGNYTVYFDYLVNGIPVQMSTHHAAVMQYRGAGLESAEFCFRAYSQTGQSLQILPMYQAAAIASSKGADKLFLMYYDTVESIECVWVNE